MLVMFNEKWLLCWERMLEMQLSRKKEQYWKKIFLFFAISSWCHQSGSHFSDLAILYKRNVCDDIVHIVGIYSSCIVIKVMAALYEAIIKLSFILFNDVFISAKNYKSRIKLVTTKTIAVLHEQQKGGARMDIKWKK